ncbi:MAG: hypothetical protein KJO07_04650, partial [Deltaproteobacteria bacterium]|nr:hypothetical protein [Deltaproteobacteria bacterium]
AGLLNATGPGRLLLSRIPDAPGVSLATPGGDSARAASGGGLTLVTGASRAPYLQRYIQGLKRPPATASVKRVIARAGLRGTTVTSIYDAGYAIFAATGYGLFRSTDGATTWVQVHFGATNRERLVRQVVELPNRPRALLMATGSGLFRSEDGGSSWTKVGVFPAFSVNHMVFDPTDPRYLYVSVYGGVFRSKDGGKSFERAYFSNLKARGNVLWLSIDPTNPKRAFAGTADGLLVTDRLRSAAADDWRLLAGLATGNQAFGTVEVDPRNPLHVITMTELPLPKINYGTAKAQSLLLESWDGGKSWGLLMSGRSYGGLRWFQIDPVRPGAVWAAWEGGIFRVERSPEPARKQTAAVSIRDLGPPVGDVVQAALEHHGLDLRQYAEKVAKAESSKWLPSRITVQAQYGLYGLGGDQDDLQFADDRYLYATDRKDMRIMAVASWSLPGLGFSASSLAMRRERLPAMNDEVRNKVMRTVRADYGELQRIRLSQRAQPDADLQTRVLRRVRAEQLEAVVDLSSGGYLSKSAKRKRRTP